MKKKCISLLLAMVLAAGLVGCGGAQQESKSASAEKEASAETKDKGDKPYDGETVTIYTSYVDKSGWKPLVDLVKEKTGITLEGISAPTNYSDLVTKLSATLTAGDDTFDIVHLDELLGVTYSTAGYLEPINDVLEPEVENYPKDVVERISKNAVDGNYYTLPMELNSMYFYVNKNVFEKAGVEVPTTKDEFIEAAQAMTGDGVYGYGASWSKGGQLFNDVIRWMYGFGGDIYDWTKPESKAALEFMYDMMYEYKIVPEAALGDTYDAMNQKIIDDKYGMVFQWGFLADVCGDKWGTNIEIAPMPTFETNKTVVCGWQMAINKNSKKIDAAKEVLKVWASEEGQTCNLKLEGSSHSAVLAKPEAKEATRFGAALDEYLKADTLIPRPMPPTVNEVMEVVETYAQSYLSNQMSLDECAEKATKEIQELVE